jgi:hypothetical protein
MKLADGGGAIEWGMESGTVAVTITLKITLK